MDSAKRLRDQGYGAFLRYTMIGRCRGELGLLQVVGIRGSPDSILTLRRLYHRALVGSGLSR